MHIRTLPKHEPELRKLADVNHRSIAAEVHVAIEAHLTAHRELLKKGPKLSPTTKRKTP